VYQFENEFILNELLENMNNMQACRRLSKLLNPGTLEIPNSETLKPWNLETLNPQLSTHNIQLTTLNPTWPK
jgi:predicted regulator of amino acid metabolism with ACT domain